MIAKGAPNDRLLPPRRGDGKGRASALSSSAVNGRFKPAVAVAALGALITWAGLILQFFLTLGSALARGLGLLEGIALYLAYFTILTNLLVALALTAFAARPRSTLGQFFRRADVCTALAAAIAFVSLGYIVLLRGQWQPEGLYLAADAALHYLSPLAFLVTWWLVLPGGRASWRIVPIALIYPLAYLLYVLVRGALTGFYPYPFFDVAELGYARVLASTAAMAAAYLVLTILLVAIARRRSAASP